jgi:wobble nucleotide-excising tRNase
MLNVLRLMRSVGQFDAVDSGARLPLGRNVLVYAENGRGKTTLTAILRSLKTGDPIPVLERRRLRAANPPHVVIDCTGGPNPAVFQNGNWSRTCPNIQIFDDQFVHETVCSGLEVHPSHRQNMHELILGPQGVALNAQFDAAFRRNGEADARLRRAAQAFPRATLHGLTPEEFCSLVARADIDRAISAEERALAAAQQAGAILRAQRFEPLRVADLGVARIEAVLRRDLEAVDQVALARVNAHISSLGPPGEQWVATGMQFVGDSGRDDCPFCAQPLQNSALTDSYRAYFSEAYGELKGEVAGLLGDLDRGGGGDARATFERAVRAMQERMQFWQPYADLPGLDFDATTFVDAWRSCFEALRALVAAKLASPLEPMAMGEEVGQLVRQFEENLQRLALLSASIGEANDRVETVRQNAGTADVQAIQRNLERLRATRDRHTDENLRLCTELDAARTEKNAAEQEREDAKLALDRYRNTVFPAYQGGINHYLEQLNAEFRISEMVSADTRGGPTCNYCLVVNSAQVPVAGAANQTNEPSFRTTLSAGDRNTLALAFFFASLDRDPNLAGSVVVIDDPISSLDDGRAVATTQELRRLQTRVAQLVILSHNKAFLCRIWEGMAAPGKTALKFERDAAGSTLAAWAVDEDCITEHDKRHALLEDYRANGPRNNQREVAKSLRPHIEAYLRVACPRDFPPGTKLGGFHQACEARYGMVDQILDRRRIDNLRDLKDFANRYMHDENPAWETEAINDVELRGFVTRTLAFTRPG